LQGIYVKLKLKFAIE